MRTLIFDIDGMTSEACAACVHRALAGVHGVAYSDVCQRTDTATVLADTALLMPGQIEAVIAGLGYVARMGQIVSHESETA